ncbi:DHH family phosphoesterase [Anaerobacillus isosaccharinicus]|uniref:Cyclic-di-AMP phosphodiesterase n=1 Tax=Anaerobacillus isosaccharinicus TaxID=1532552 RepID=A0A1S2MGE1_9BACI|nr:DHH family phosphoesterase [Anaerobacillus isosaccharinicus]MBA5584232.1 DHH family phosphoesterase [Anaerobacillus isosaccharinicus]QOY37366.1 DHH family phosphoesterase [Anaerobacillus isosaccharinicus]
MPEFLLKRWHGYHIIALFAVAFIFIGILTIYQWIIGLLGFLSLGILLFYTIQARNLYKRDIEEYISTLTYRVNKAGEEAVTKLPIGILLYNEEKIIQWANPMVNSIIEEDCIGSSISKIAVELADAIESGQNEVSIQIGENVFRTNFRRDERLIYFFDITEETKVKKLYEKEQTVIAIIYLDNYDEVTQGMEDQIRSKLMSQVTSSLNSWSKEHGVFLRRTSSDRFLAIFHQEILEKIEETKFDLLDEVREATAREKIPITLSIGVGSGQGSLQELGILAQSSLDLALGRGGDQVAIKQKNGKVRFYGGKSNAVEKRTRVRARVISHAIRDFILESDRVMIMGHISPDMDAIGAAIGVLKLAELNGKEGYIILDRNNISRDVRKLMEEVEKHDRLWAHFITPEEALEEVTPNTLLVVVDTHKPSLVIEPKLLDKIDRVIVLDHHRRGEEFIDEAVLVYMEPYASSTSELVTELLEYQPKQTKLDLLEATALLAGIIVDTKSFAVRTGSRTFDAASYLRSKGADTHLVQNLLKQDLDQYIKRSRLIESAHIYRNGIAIAKGNPDEVCSQVLIAQAADTLLSMNDVVASFVISKRKDGATSISARSLSDVNVQLIMEMLDGGGHLTNAATQLGDVSLDEAERLLMEKIDQYFEGGREE